MNFINMILLSNYLEDITGGHLKLNSHENKFLLKATMHFIKNTNRFQGNKFSV